MSEERNNNQIHDLVLFKTGLRKDNSNLEEISLESVDQENMVKLVSELTPFGAHYRYSVVLANQSIAPITEIKIRIKYPSFLELKRISPPAVNIKSIDDSDKDIVQVTLEFDELDGKNKRQINLYFEPLILNSQGNISTFITFVNNKDFVRVINSEAIELFIKPITIEPKIIPSYQVGGFLQKSGIKKGIKSLGIGIENDTNLGLYFNNIEQILRLHNLQLIVKDEEKQKSWFYGTDLETKEDILIINQIVSNKVEILIASQVHQILISLLTKLTTDFKKRILSTGYISNINEIYELDCKYCGAILPYFPSKGESIECNSCHNPQTIW